MSTPSFRETLNSPLGPDITVIEEGDFFSDNEQDDVRFNISTMNTELAGFSEHEKIVFMEGEEKIQDIPFQKFLEARQQQPVDS